MRRIATRPLLGRWFVLRFNYPPSAQVGPRYGYGRPPHPRLTTLIRTGDEQYRALLGRFARHSDALGRISLRKTDPSEPHWQNAFLFGIDGASLYCFVRERAPRRYLEVGSGNSTLFVDRARRDGDTHTQITSIDPNPRREVNEICNRVLRKPLEEIDLGIFSDLRAGDIVFLDGTHRVFTNSDAVVFFLDVLPELAPGVLVGVHDIHLPEDYPPRDTDAYYSEQYLLACSLLAEPHWMTTILPCWYVSGHPELEPLVANLLPQGIGSRGRIYWLEIQAREPAGSASA